MHVLKSDLISNMLSTTACHFVFELWCLYEIRFTFFERPLPYFYIRIFIFELKKYFGLCFFQNITWMRGIYFGTYSYTFDVIFVVYWSTDIWLKPEIVNYFFVFSVRASDLVFRMVERNDEGSEFKTFVLILFPFCKVLQFSPSFFCQTIYCSLYFGYILSANRRS